MRVGDVYAIGNPKVNVTRQCAVNAANPLRLHMAVQNGTGFQTIHGGKVQKLRSAVFQIQDLKAGFESLATAKKVTITKVILQERQTEINKTNAS